MAMAMAMAMAMLGLPHASCTDRADGV